MPKYDLYITADPDGRGISLVEDGSGVLLGVAGIHSLSGMVMRMLFTTKGRWPGKRSEGSIMANMVGRNMDPLSLKANLLRAVRDVETTILQQQVNKARPLDEALDSLEVIDLTFPSVDQAKMRILIKSVSGARLINTLGITV